MRVLVSGAAGYVGSHLIRRLLDGAHEVVALTRRPVLGCPWFDHEALSWVVADLFDAAAIEAALAGVEACVHAAFVWGDPADDLKFLDTAATAHLFDAAGRAGVRRAIHVSSAAVHRPFSPRMSEADPLRTTDLYGATKAASELAMWAACARYGMGGAVLRPGPVVGPPAWPGAAFRSPAPLAALAEAARLGEPLRVNGADGRQLVAATDVAEVVARLLVAPEVETTLLCVDPEPTAWAEVATHLIALTGCPGPVQVGPGPALEDVPRFDIARLQATLGVVPDSRTALRAHLAHLAHLVARS